jgi:HEAT repeat protein
MEIEKITNLIQASLIQTSRVDARQQQYEAINELKGLHKAGNAQVIAQLLESLRGPDAEVRSNVIKILKEGPFRDDPRVIEPIIRALEDENPRVRYEAAYALADLQTTAAVTPLIAVLNDEDESVQEYAVYALGEICIPRAFEPLKRLYPTATEKVKKRIEQALAKIHKVFPEESL